MKIARLLANNMETYGFVNGKSVITKEEITSQTGIPIPQNIKDFLFDGWYEEVKPKVPKLNFIQNLSDFKFLAPIPNPSKIVCLAFNYKDHAKEQNLIPPDEPSIIIKPRSTLNGATSDIICPSFVSKLDYEIELAVIIGANCKNISDKEAKDIVFGYMIINDTSNHDI